MIEAASGSVSRALLKALMVSFAKVVGDGPDVDGAFFLTGCDSFASEEWLLFLLLGRMGLNRIR